MGEFFGEASSGWGSRKVGGVPAWPSDLTDDHTPFELSVALDGDSPELRILVEVQGMVPNWRSNWLAAVRFNDLLSQRFGANLERFRQIDTLFTPGDSSARFGLWHAACFKPSGPPEFKVYLNPRARQPERPRATIVHAMERLGFGKAGEYLPAATAEDTPLYFSIDLGNTAEARVKAYTGHHGATPEHVEAALSSAKGYVPGQVSEFCRVMGGPLEAFGGRPVQTCLAFTAGNPAPTSGTVYFPVRSYADSDLEVKERVLSYIPANSENMYRNALLAFANRFLEEGIGMQSYVSLRQAPQNRRLTVYLSPECYATVRSEHAGAVSGVVVRDDAGSSSVAPRRRFGIGGR